MTKFEDEYPGVTYPRTTAALNLEGVTRHVLGGRRYKRVSRGLHVPEGTVTTTTQRIVEAAAAMGPRGVLGGWAAAFVLGVDQLDGHNDFTMHRLPVPLLMPRHIHRKSTATLDYRQDELDGCDVWLRHGLRVTSAVRTTLDLMCWAESLNEGVVALDAMLTAGAVELGDVARALPSFVGQQGTRIAARAVELAAPGALSSWESRLRVFCVDELGWPPLLVNHPVFDAAGRFLGAPDLLDEAAGLALEYDGSQWTGSEVSGGHRNREQHRADNVREEAFERAGLVVVRADKADLTRYRGVLRSRLQRARRQGLSRDRRLDRWTTIRRSA